MSKEKEKEPVELPYLTVEQVNHENSIETNNSIARAIASDRVVTFNDLVEKLETQLREAQAGLEWAQSLLLEAQNACNPKPPLEVLQKYFPGFEWTNVLNVWTGRPLQGKWEALTAKSVDENYQAGGKPRICWKLYYGSELLYQNYDLAYACKRSIDNVTILLEREKKKAALPGKTKKSK